MVYKYLKDEKIDQDVKKYTVNPKDGFITFEFNDHEKAKNYYERANFKHKILVRPFNIYFNLQLSDNEMKKYYFEGLNEDNLRKMFEVAKDYGMCKIYTSYTATTSKGKLKPTGVLSFIRNSEISETQFAKLKKELEDKVSVKIYPYVSDKGLKCSVFISSFYNAGTEDDDEITKKADEKIKQMMNSILKNPDDIETINISIRRKEKPDPENSQKPIVQTNVKALV